MAPEQAGGGIRLLDRTNKVLESFFHTMEHGERRRSGRKILTQDFERLPPAAALAINLMTPNYVQIVCGTLDRLPEVFAELDAGNRSHSMAAGPRNVTTTVETASLNTFGSAPHSNSGNGQPNYSCRPEHLSRHPGPFQGP